jgi:hypothetical protein
MLPFRRLAASFAAAALLVCAAAPRAGADEGDGKESRSIWDRVTGAADDAVDWALPGDSLADKAWAIPTGKSPFSPPVNLGNVENIPKAQRWVAENAGRALIPGYGAALDLRDDVTGAVDRNVPGGMRTVGVAGLVLVLLLLWKLLMPAAVQAGKGAVAAYVPGGAAVVKAKSQRPARPAPPRRTTTRHAPAAAPKVTWSHSGQARKTDVIRADRNRLVLCADDEDAALVGARKRFQGYRVRSVFCVPCDITPDKVHAHVRKDGIR